MLFEFHSKGGLKNKLAGYRPKVFFKKKETTILDQFQYMCI